jgi:hypothetical protein
LEQGLLSTGTLVSVMDGLLHAPGTPALLDVARDLQLDRRTRLGGITVGSAPFACPATFPNWFFGNAQARRRMAVLVDDGPVADVSDVRPAKGAGAAATLASGPSAKSGPVWLDLGRPAGSCGPQLLLPEWQRDNAER